MLKQKLVAAALALALLLVLLPNTSQAAPRNVRITLSSPVTDFIAKIERWWVQILNGSESLSATKALAAPRIGCGIDPNGQQPEDGSCPGSEQGPESADSGSN
jgi:hypothetical protein